LQSKKVINLHPGHQASGTEVREAENGKMLVTLNVAELKELIQGAVTETISQNVHHEGDKLLTAEKAAEFLSVSPDWLYRHANKLPFTRKLGSKMLRFSSQGIQKYLATRKTS